MKNRDTFQCPGTNMLFMMKKRTVAIFASLMMLVVTSGTSCEKKAQGGSEQTGQTVSDDLASRNLLRAIQLVDNAVINYFDEGNGMAMSRYYNPYTGEASSELGSVWMYTSSIEAVNAVLGALHALKEAGQPELYDAHFERYSQLLAKLYDKLSYYGGRFTLTSFTRTENWSVYAVNRASAPGSANVEGKENVYDDQQWLVRELIEAYELTGNKDYFDRAEYLAEYVLDGWDCTIKDGKERGGIPWGPGYYSKHSCSNGPMVSPCVWLHEHYKGRPDETVWRHIAPDGMTRVGETMKKDDYYLMFAKKIYDWQKENLMYPASSGDKAGLYADNLNGPSLGGTIQYETVDGVLYRKPSDLKEFCDPPITYNSGTMLSGAADLYRITGDDVYLQDIKELVGKSFTYFAKLGETKPGLYTYDITGFRNWFNGVLMRGYVDVWPFCADAALPIDSFQHNLDYAYDNYLYENMLPASLLVGWNTDKSKNRVEGMFTFAFAAEYAVLARYLKENQK